MAILESASFLALSGMQLARPSAKTCPIGLGYADTIRVEYPGAVGTICKSRGLPGSFIL
jgi:hypothetical protein